MWHRCRNWNHCVFLNLSLRLMCQMITKPKNRLTMKIIQKIRTMVSSRCSDELSGLSAALLLMLLPVLLYAVWLIFSYRNNVINSVPLSFGLDMLAAILGMIAYFRMAGYAFGAAKPWRALLGAMLSATVCIMSLADGRYMGMEIILLATAGQMLLYVWILLQNLRERERKVVVKKDDGFEHL